MTRTLVHLLVTSPAGARSSMGRYADLVRRALGEHAPEFEVVRHDLAPAADAFRRWPAPLRIHLHHAAVALAARRLARAGGDGLWHLLDGSHGYAAMPFPKERTVVTCHDLIPARMVAGTLGRRPSLPSRLLIHRGMAGLRRAGAVVADSGPSARDAREIAGVAPSRLSILPVPLDPRWMGLIREPRAPIPGSRGYLLHLGHDAAYKNRPAVWRIFQRIAARWPGRLVIAGSPCSPELAADIAGAGLSRRVEFFDSPDDGQLADLYRGASLLLFPSLFEGFGWPPLEALACGCPAIASDVGGLRDVLGDDPPCLFDPADEDGMARAALDLLENPARADAWVAAGRARVAACTGAALARGLARVYARLAGLEGVS